jgi:hypothetical protein
VDDIGKIVAKKSRLLQNDWGIKETPTVVGDGGKLNEKMSGGYEYHCGYAYFAEDRDGVQDGSLYNWNKKNFTEAHAQVTLDKLRTYGEDLKTQTLTRTVKMGLMHTMKNDLDAKFVPPENSNITKKRVTKGKHRGVTQRGGRHSVMMEYGGKKKIPWHF